MTTGTAGKPDTECRPYIGPRPFTRADAPFFKGRDREAAILEGLVLSKRVVLLFAESGAGKSSLIEAGLIPRLIAKQSIGRGARARTYQKMQVLPVLSVGGSFPPGEALPQMNVFVFLALSSLLSEASRADIEKHGDFTAGLAAFFKQAKLDEVDEELAGDILLIFDQFEELFSQHDQRWRDRAGFFEQVIAALNKFPRLHILFTMREDFIAELVPYSGLFADDLRTRFRLERLDETNALQAVVDPAEKCGRRYGEGVAERLVQSLGGQPQEALSSADAPSEEALRKAQMPLMVEPVHLQIVCQQLWENLEPKQTVIAKGDVLKFGDVDEALADFYNRNIERVVGQTAVSERNLRAWFEKDLITSKGRRGLFYYENIGEARISAAAVALLSQAYIVRRVERSLDVWYELAHDRMIAPVIAANEVWRAGYLQENPLANAYQASLNDPAFLLRGEPLEKARRFANEHEEEILPAEAEFLQECVEAEQARIRRRNWVLGGIAAVVLIAIAAIASALLINQLRREADDARMRAERLRETAEEQRGIAEEQKIIAEENARNARSRELAAAALNNLGTDPELGILLALQALETIYTPEAENALHQALQAARIERRFTVAGQRFRDVAVNSNGTRLAAVGSDGRIRVWDLTDPGAGDPWRIFPAEIEESTPPIIHAVAFNPLNDSQLATAHEDGFLIIWDIDRGVPINEFKQSDYPVLSLTYTAGGSDIITAMPNDNQARRRLDGTSFNHPFIYDLAVSEDGRWLATAGKANVRFEEEDGMVKIWDIQADPGGAGIILPLKRLADHTGGVWAVDFSPDGRYLASGSEDKTVIVYDISELEANADPSIAAVHYEHSDTIADLTFSANSRCLISAGLDGTAKVWDVKTGQLLHNLTGHTDQVRGVAVLGAPPQGEEVPPTEICGPGVITAGSDGTIRFWDLRAPEEEQTLSEHTEPVESVDFSSSGEGIVTGGDDGRVIIWETTSGEPEVELIDSSQGLDRAHAERVNRALFSPDDRFIATAGWDDVVKIWDAASGDVTRLEGHTARIESIDFNADGSLLASVSDDGTARIWSVPEGDCLKIFMHNETGINENNMDSGKVYGVRFHPQDEYLVTTGGDGWVRGWRLTEDALAGTGSCEDARQQALGADINFAPEASCAENPANCTVHDAVFNDDGTQLATVDWQADVVLRAFPEGTVISELSGHTKRLYGAQFEPGANELATAGEDGQVRIWDLASGRTKQILPGPEFNALDFNDDGDLLAVAGEDGTARIYALELEHLIELARERLTRNKLTAEECAQYELQESAVCQ